ncbi:hypothetical protein [Streptomyces sp. NPDC001843]|uniref:hypothetical protein n=1 Tax=Streptomyces sp. NPDC001843 TaxID=3364617 RepID=UPI0036B924F5
MPYSDPQDLADRYLAPWTEPDATARRQAVERLWAESGTHVLHPPAEIRRIAAELGFDQPTLEARGHDAVETRMARSHERFVAKGGLTFRPVATAVRMGNVVKFHWETVEPGSGQVLGRGLVVLVLDGEDRISTDYMFPGD